MTDKEELKRRLKESSAAVLLVGDIHLMDKPPRNCTDSYLDDIFEILEFTAELEKGLDLDAVIWAGDIFHHKQPSRTSHRLVLRAIDAVKKYRRLLIVTGNHDISNDRLETVGEQQPLGVLFEAGAEELDGWDRELPIFGIPWQQRWFEDGILEEAFAGWRDLVDLELQQAELGGSSKEVLTNRGLRPKETSSSLVVTHAPIYPPADITSLKFEAIHPSSLADAMKHRGSLYYGHIHEDHGIYEADGVTFANMGAISRGSLTEYNLERSIKAALWTPEHGFLEIDLPHKPAKEVFLIEQALELKEKKISNDQFLESVGSTRLEVSSTAGVIAYIRELEDVPLEVKKTAIELLELQDA